MFGYEEELQDEIALLKAENEKLKLRLSVVIKSLPTTEELKSKLTKTWVEETTNSGQVYRQYLTKKQVNKLLEILVKK
jgi:hypothetical protein